VYRGLASAAESGWDFSSRWFNDVAEISSIETENFIPVDLNSILYKVEMTLSNIFSITDNHLKKHFYQHKAINRHKSIKKYLWNEDQGIWNDYNIKQKKRNTDLYISNILPLWAEVSALSDEQVEKLMNTISPLLEFEGGTPTSLFMSGQQWDFPNAWSPLEYFLIKALENTSHSGANEYAKSIANKWIYNNYCTWKKTGHMFEKYDVYSMGTPGHGGEYDVQEGFGWTNGVALYLIRNYGHNLLMPDC
jgi:alpha,alpha-trehalase